METTIMGYILGVIPEEGGPRWQEGPDRLIDLKREVALERRCCGW